MPELFSQTFDVSQSAIPVWLDLSAVAVGSVSGVLVAQEKKLDLIGYIALALLGGLGGGLVRDSIMQRGGVYMISSVWPISMSIIAAAIGFLFPSTFRKHPNLLEWIDIISVGLFVAAGTDKAILFQLNPLAILFMGIITGVGGGMLRDVFMGEPPRIFVRSNFYAICAVGGAIAYSASISFLHLNRPYAAILCVLVTTLLRRWSLRYNIMSPNEIDLSQRVQDIRRKRSQSHKSREMALRDAQNRRETTVIKKHRRRFFFSRKK